MATGIWRAITHPFSLFEIRCWYVLLSCFLYLLQYCFCMHFFDLSLLFTIFYWCTLKPYKRLWHDRVMALEHAVVFWLVLWQTISNFESNRWNQNVIFLAFISFWIYSWPWNNVGPRGTNIHTPLKICIELWLLKNLTRTNNNVIFISPFPKIKNQGGLKALYRNKIITVGAQDCRV